MVLAASVRSDGVDITCIFASALIGGLDWVHDLVCSCISPLEDKICHLHVLMFYSSKLYIPVTKHIKPFKSLAPETTMVGTQDAFEGRSLYLSVFLTSLFHKSSHYPTSWLLGNLSTKLVCVKRGAFQGRITQIKGKQVAFVKRISEMESIILFQYECSGRVKIRGEKTELKIAISV